MQALSNNQIESSAESNDREPVNEQAMAAILLFLLPFIIASLLKPRFLEPNNDPKALHVRIESLWSISLGLSIIVISLTSIVAFLLAIFVDHSLLGMEKVVFVQLSLFISMTALLIANNRQFLLAQLEMLELEASTARDETMHLIQSIQMVLSRLNHQLEGATQEEVANVSSLIKSLAPPGNDGHQSREKRLPLGICSSSGGEKRDVLSEKFQQVVSMKTSENSQPKFDFAEYIGARRQLIETTLDKYLKEGQPDILWQSMRYSLLDGGKRLRAVLCFAGAEVSSHLNQDQIAAIVLPCACAIEMVHAMSLIHDDLPALDNDDMRRGKPTNHRVFGEAIALLAGDALLMMANDVLITKTPDNIDRSVLLEVALELARATGAAGMVGGQVYDLAFTGRLEQVKSELAITADTSTLELIHRGKTGALIKFSLWSGGKLVGASDAELEVLNRFSEILGLAFQIADDLLDVTGDIKTLGKTPGKDLAANKVTWTTLYGEEGARMKLKQLEEEGLAVLDMHGSSNPSLTALKQLLQYAIHRSS